MVLGTFLCGLSFALVGYSAAGWMVFFGIIIFSAGEMFSSPKFLEFVGNMAPADNKAMYLGFANLPQAVGWMLESYIVPGMYGQYAAKETLARQWLHGQGLSDLQLTDIPQGDAFSYLLDFSGQSAAQMTAVLYQANNVGIVWYVAAVVAVFTGFGLIAYGVWVKKLLGQ